MDVECWAIQLFKAQSMRIVCVNNIVLVMAFNVHNKYIIRDMSMATDTRYICTFRAKQAFMSYNIFAILKRKTKLGKHKRVSTCHTNEKILMNEWNINNSLPQQRFNTLLNGMEWHKGFCRLHIIFLSSWWNFTQMNNLLFMQFHRFLNSILF